MRENFHCSSHGFQTARLRVDQLLSISCATRINLGVTRHFHCPHLSLSEEAAEYRHARLQEGLHILLSVLKGRDRRNGTSFVPGIHMQTGVHSHMVGLKEVSVHAVWA